MAVHDRNELGREDRRISARIHASLMSDAKWRELLSALDRPGLALERRIVKFIGIPEEKIISHPSGLHTCFGGSPNMGKETQAFRKRRAHRMSKKPRGS